jgi:hypothetical protein
MKTPTPEKVVPENRPPANKQFWLQYVIVPIVAALIVCMGSIVAALAGAEPFASYLVNFLPSLATPTATLTTIPHSFTATETHTLTPFPLTEETKIPEVPGEDWQRGCIGASIWSPSLSGEPFSQPPDCYQLIQWGFAPIDGKLNMVTQRQVFTAKDYGLFAPWRDEWTKLDFFVHAKTLKNSEVWVGLFADKSLSADGVVFVIQPGDNVDIRLYPSGVEFISNFFLPSAHGKYDVRMILRGAKLEAWEDGQLITTNAPMNFETRYLYVGYRALPSMELDAQISNLKFSP